MKSVLIVGNSHVRRMMHSTASMNLDSSRSSISYCGFIGPKALNLLEELWNSLEWVLETYGVPDVVVIIMGSNDLCHNNRLFPVDYSCQVLAIAQEFRAMGTSQVLIAEALPRYGVQAFSACPQFFLTPGINSLADAERELLANVNKSNSWVKIGCKVPGLNFITFKGLHQAFKLHLEDGLHLTALGRRKMRNSLRRDIVVALLRCRGGK